MTGAEWIIDKINSGQFENVAASLASENIVFIERGDKEDAYVGIVPIRKGDSNPIVGIDEAMNIHAERPDLAMMIAIPKAARWSGRAMRWLQSEETAFGGVGDLLSAIIYDDEMSTHRNKTFAFVDDGLRRHRRVADLEWINNKKVEVRLRNDQIITVGLEDAYDITMTIARDAARIMGDFDVLLKTNPNGSITSSGAENVERLGFQTLKWGDLFAYLAKRSGQASSDDLRERLRRTRSTT